MNSGLYVPTQGNVGADTDMHTAVYTFSRGLTSAQTSTRVLAPLFISIFFIYSPYPGFKSATISMNEVVILERLIYMLSTFTKYAGGYAVTPLTHFNGKANS